MLAILAFLRSPAGRYVLIGLAALVVVYFVRAHWIGQGVEQERKAEDASLKAAEARVAERERKAQDIAQRAQKALSDRQVQIQTVTRTLIEKVPTYVTAKADAGCVVPVGFVRLHDAAASGSPASLSSASGGPVEAPSGVALSAVTGTIAWNYGEALQWRAEAQSWRDWYVREKALWDRR